MPSSPEIRKKGKSKFILCFYWTVFPGITQEEFIAYIKNSMNLEVVFCRDRDNVLEIWALAKTAGVVEDVLRDTYVINDIHIQVKQFKHVKMRDLADGNLQLEMHGKKMRFDAAPGNASIRDGSNANGHAEDGGGCVTVAGPGNISLQEPRASDDGAIGDANPGEYM